jgi:DNA-binding response OmpR family regulator
MKPIGCLVTTVSTATEAFQRAGREKFNLYLLDRKLPDGDGIDLCHKLKEIDPSIPIIFFSAEAHASEVERALECGALNYIVKPGDMYNLAKTIADLMSREGSP